MSGTILITGGTGQLGNALQALSRQSGLKIVTVSRPEFDFNDLPTVETCFAAAQPSLVINAAAYTAVDAAESHYEAAKAGNHIGPLKLANLCAATDIPFIHVSTDYVFDGYKGSPYFENDITAPTGVYGLTKRDGEVAILATTAKAIILRTSWVYAAHGKNFVRTMLNAAHKTNALRVVADQRGTPTAAPDLAAAILDIVSALQSGGWDPAYRGIYHATGQGETTWFDFAGAIFAATPAAFPRPSLSPIVTADWPTPAKRPADSRLNCGKIEKTFGVTFPPWQASLPPIVASLIAQDALVP
ncbi:MAG TPA: dTDP-4-dehydrorhamnose reductase [Halothiobacillus sp.]|nr:MAG: dTDP-4-dehydrorhamnose reductase [Acidocella sp. 20-61-6]HQT42891.1 dTDP-4-dehydrorhamnose reductase [Halothiobacillus sp.]